MFVKASVLKDIIYAVVSTEQEASEMLEQTSFSIKDLEDQDLEVDWIIAQDIWRVVEGYSGEPNIGLKVGYQTPIESTGLVGILTQSCETIQKAWEEISRFNGLYTDMMRFSFERNQEGFIIIFEPASDWVKYYPNTARQAVSQASIAICRIFSALCRKSLHPKKVQFTFREPTDSKDYKDLFGDVVQYGFTRNSIIFNQFVGDYRIVSYASNVYLSLKKLCIEQLEKQTSKNKSVRNDVEKLILERLDSGNCNLKEIARELGFGERTLQRNLAQEGVSFKGLFNDIRIKMARKLLETGIHNVSEVAIQLGYIELSSFRKRFIQSEGQSPKQYQLEKQRTV